MTASLNNPPVNGDALILTFLGGDTSANPYVSSITWTGVTWTMQAHLYDNNNINAQIWLGVVGASAASSGTLNLTNGSGGHGFEIVNVQEWFGIVTTGFLDQTQTNESTTAESSGITTGTTSQTTQTYELVIACFSTVATAGAQTLSGPSSGYTLVDGVGVQFYTYSDYLANGLAYYVATAEAQMSCSVSSNEPVTWCNCIATFKAASGVPATFVRHWLW